MNARSITLALGGKWNGKSGQACCPAHHDRNPSLSIRDGERAPLFTCHAGCTSQEVADKLRERNILNGESKASWKPNGHGTSISQKVIANHSYVDENGETLFVVERLDPKKPNGFRQRRSDGKGGWIWSIGETRRVLYRLPELIEAVALERPIFIAEGEKAVDALVGIGVNSTCSPGGAGKWRDEYSQHLKGANAIILPDNDEAGEKHAQQVARSLHGIAEVRILRLPDLPSKGDPFDWIEDGGTAEKLWSLVEGCEAPSCIPTPEREDYALTCVADVTPQPVEWVWSDRLALGKITLLGGDPDLGKSQISIDAAARITTGTHWPNGARARVGSAIFICSEDDTADTIAPRLEAAGADLTKVHVFHSMASGKRKTFSLQDDLERLARAIHKIGDVSLVTLDAITSYMGAKIDSHRTTDVRAVLEPVGDFAKEHGVSILAITHPPKAAHGNALHAFTGSLAFVAAARLAFFVTSEAETNRRLLLSVKNNLGPLAPGLGYSIGTKTITNGIIAPHVLWDDAPVDLTANQAMAAAAEAKRDGGSMHDAKQFLREILANGPVAVREVDDAAEGNLIRKRTLYRARKQMGITSTKSDFDGGWVLALPKDAKDAAEGCQL
jgi:hypothetical protein